MPDTAQLTWRFGDGTVVTLLGDKFLVAGRSDLADVVRYVAGMLQIGFVKFVDMAPAGDAQQLTPSDPRIVDRWLRDTALQYRVTVLEAPEVGEWPIPDDWGELPESEPGDVILF